MNGNWDDGKGLNIPTSWEGISHNILRDNYWEGGWGRGRKGNLKPGL